MITLVAVGIGFLVVMAVVVGVVDAFQAAEWRRVARERRRTWEARRFEYSGGHDSPLSDDDE